MLSPKQGLPYLVMGFDPSPNGTAVVALHVDGKGEISKVEWLAFCKRAGDEGAYPQGEYIFIPKTITDKKTAVGDFDRHHFVVTNIKQWMLRVTEPYLRDNCSWSDSVVSAFEGYAMGAVGRTFLIGETQGLLRYEAYQRGLVRLYDIQGIKIFGCDNGGAKKEEMLQAYYEHGRDEAHALDIPFENITDDLCDAWWIATMLYTEIQLRHGNVELKDLKARRRQFFLRVTDKDPVNVLAREFQSIGSFKTRVEAYTTTRKRAKK